MLTKEYFKELLKSEIKQPELWVGGIYRTVDSKLYKNTKISEITDFDKKQFNELTVLEWSIYLFPNIKTYLKKSLRNNTFYSFSEKDENKPDFRLNNEYYEVTSKITIFNGKKGDEPGIDFERRIMKDSMNGTILNINDKNVTTHGNKNAKLALDLGWWFKE